MRTPRSDAKRVDASAPLTITESAATAISRLISSSTVQQPTVVLSATRHVPVRDRYQLELVHERLLPGSMHTWIASGHTIAMTEDTRRLVEGTTLDYHKTLWQHGFSFTNPRAYLLMASDNAKDVFDYIRVLSREATAAHKGNVTLVDVREDVCYVAFGGRCQGCALAPQTLAESLRPRLLSAFPWLRGVIDVTDHMSGEDPYA